MSKNTFEFKSCGLIWFIFYLGTLVDFSKKGFEGYLVETYQPYNMYLRIGIGIFCLVTLIQCVIDMAEAIENKAYAKSGCIVESYDAIIAALQFVFSCLQFLFIFLKGNVSKFLQLQNFTIKFRFLFWNICYFR